MRTKQRWMAVILVIFVGLSGLSGQMLEDYLIGSWCIYETCYDWPTLRFTDPNANTMYSWKGEMVIMDHNYWEWAEKFYGTILVEGSWFAYPDDRIVIFVHEDDHRMDFRVHRIDRNTMDIYIGAHATRFYRQ